MYDTDWGGRKEGREERGRGRGRGVERHACGEEWGGREIPGTGCTVDHWVVWTGADALVVCVRSGRGHTYNGRKGKDRERDK